MKHLLDLIPVLLFCGILLYYDYVCNDTMSRFVQNIGFKFMYLKPWVIKQESCRHQVLTRQFTINNLDQILQHFEVAKDNYF